MSSQAIDKPAREVEELNDGLTERQRRFCIEYLKCGVGIQAARLAGYNGKPATLGAIASENLTKPLIRAYIEKAGLSAKERLEKELATIAYGKPMDPLTHQSKLRALELGAKIQGLLDKEERKQSITVNQLFLDVKAMDEQQLLAQLKSLEAKRSSVVADDAEVIEGTMSQEGQS